MIGARIRTIQRVRHQATKCSGMRNAGVNETANAALVAYDDANRCVGCPRAWSHAGQADYDDSSRWFYHEMYQVWFCPHCTGGMGRDLTKDAKATGQANILKEDWYREMSWVFKNAQRYKNLGPVAVSLSDKAKPNECAHLK